MSNNITNRMANATKWSAVTEILSKLVTPVSSMVLARILAPEVFGVVTSINLVISFCDVFADAGFQKYIIQRNNKEKKELDHICNVAFWTNLFISLLIWFVIFLFEEPIAKLVGSPGEGFALTIACVNLPLHAFTSIQNARLKRELDFKKLFYVRGLTILIPFVVTIPLALITRSFWALIIGTIAMNAATVVVMYFIIEWKPRFDFSFKTLRIIFGFSIWSLLESILVWVINWGDTFVIGMLLSQHYLGLYKTAMNIVNQIVGVVSATLTPVLLSALSRAQDDDNEFKKIYYNTSFYTGILLFPMSIGMYVYRDLMCEIALGSAWLEAAPLMGIWGFVSAIAIIFNSYNGSVLIAKGKPKLSVIVQIVQIAAIIPAVYITAKMDFETLSYTRSLIRFFGMIVHAIVVWKLCGLSTLKLLKMLLPSIMAAVVMGLAGIVFIYYSNGIVMELLSILACCLIYLLLLMIFPTTRRLVCVMADKVFKRLPVRSRK